MTSRARITTARLTLRPLIPADAPALAVALDDFGISQWLAVVPYPYSAQDAAWFITDGQHSVGRVWGICDGTGLVGVISIGTGRDFGYWLARRAWGLGYATEAGRAVVGEWFRAADAGDLLSGHFAGNTASRRVLAKLGFAETGPGTTHSVARNADVASVDMVLTRGACAAADPFTVATERLVLRPLRADDAPAIRAQVTQPAVGRNLLIFPSDWAEDDARVFARTWGWRGVPMVRLAITLRGDDRCIGTIGIGQGVPDQDPDSTAVFYWLDPLQGGRGLASEALAGFLPAAVARFGPLRFDAEVFTDNPASARVLEKAGFSRVGQGMGRSAQRLEPASIWLYRLTLSDQGQP